MRTFFLFGIFIFSLFVMEVFARPISYPQGWTIMQMNDFNKHSVHLHLSPSKNYSLGYRGEYWRKEEWQFHGAQINYLINRLNKPRSQANLYFKNGAGIAVSDYKNFDNKILPSFFSGISFDWEDRQYFINYENRMSYSFDIEKFFHQKIRFGFAPYIGKYGDLHTWLMFQIEHMPSLSDKLVYTPFLRMFKGDYLTEFGISNQQNFMFNLVRRF